MEEILEILSKNNISVELDLTTPTVRSNDATKKVYELVAKVGYLDYTLFCLYERYVPCLINISEGSANFLIDFTPADIEKIRDMAQYKTSSNIVYLTLPWNKISKAIVDECHANELLVEVWTVDEEEDCKNLYSIGVDNILSNTLLPSLFMENLVDFK